MNIADQSELLILVAVSDDSVPLVVIMEIRRTNRTEVIRSKLPKAGVRRSIMLANFCGRGLVS